MDQIDQVESGQEGAAAVGPADQPMSAEARKSRVLGITHVVLGLVLVILEIACEYSFDRNNHHYFANLIVMQKKRIENSLTWSYN